MSVKTSHNSLPYSLQKAAYQCLMLSDAQEKIEQTIKVRAKWCANDIVIDPSFIAKNNCDVGLPKKPKLVPFNQLPKRTLTSELGHAALIHSFAHIEYNAINIAWDAVQRFNSMPDEYYNDWSQVAAEEAYHFRLLRDYLISLGFDYGSFDAHAGLWEMVEETAHDVLVRMALVPRVLEARGLDVTPDIIKRFRKHKLNKAADILDIIYQDEIGHVAIGTRWFKYTCEQRRLNSDETFASLINQYAIDKIRKPFNVDAREQAGFSETEMAYLSALK